MPLLLELPWLHLNKGGKGGGGVHFCAYMGYGKMIVMKDDEG